MCGYFSFYDVNDRCWHDLAHFAFHNRSPPENTALVVAQDRLYAAGGRVELEREYDDDYEYDEHNPEEYEDYYQCQQDFACYDSVKNKWDKLPPMLEGRHDFKLVHLPGFIYAVGGVDEDDDAVNEVECYDLEKKKWCRRASLPRGYEWESFVPFKGKILACGKSTAARKESASTSTHEHVILVYNPAIDFWQNALGEQHTDHKGFYVAPPVLYVYKDQCYRVRYQKTCDGIEHTSCCVNTPQEALVNVLEFNPVGDVVSLAIGEEVKQDLIPQNTLGAFRIQSAVFVNVREFVGKINVEISADRKTDVNLCRWKGLRNSHFAHSSIVLLTFDRKRLGTSY